MEGWALALLTLILASCTSHAGVRGWRADVGGTKQPKRRELVVGPRDTNVPPSIIPEHQNNTEIVAQVGGTASIKCYTHLLGDDMVTWTKRDQDQLLTAGAVVYSSEDRYSVAHVTHHKVWELWVRDVRRSDAGLYECQLTSHPPTSLFFTLKVVEAKAVIEEGAEVHVHTGAQLGLHCRVEEATEQPQYIFWFHNGTMINYSPRRSVQVIQHQYQSTLWIPNVTWQDAGAYTCEPHLATPANLTLHVLEGEKHAALHNGQQADGAEYEAAADSTQTTPTWLVTDCLPVLLLLRHRLGCSD